MDDMCGDWYDESDSYYDNGRVDDGWGVDSSEFTTELDKSKYTPEQIARAEALARQIQGEMRHLGNQRFDKDTQQSFQQQQHTPSNSTAVNQIGSAEDALALLRQRKLEQEQQQYQQPLQAQYGQHPPPQVTPQAQHRMNEEAAIAYLRAQLDWQCGLVLTHGDPSPRQAATLLGKMAGQLTAKLPYPPPDIKLQVMNVFLAVGWDVRTRRPVPGSSPPDGRTICDLTFGLTCFFAGRLGQQYPANPNTRLPPKQFQPQRQVQPQRQPQRQNYQQQSRQKFQGRPNQGNQRLAKAASAANRQGNRHNSNNNQFQGGNAKQRRQQRRQQGQGGGQTIFTQAQNTARGTQQGQNRPRTSQRPQRTNQTQGNNGFQRVSR